MNLRRHPKNQSLEEWLNGGGSAEVDAHIVACERCADYIENLETATRGPEVPSDDIAELLASAFEPPENLCDRLEKGVVARLDSKEMLNVFADLFGAGIETSKLLFTEEEHYGND